MKYSVFDFIILLLIGIYTSCNAEKKTFHQPNKNSRKPNILFILADDLGYYDLSYTGSKFYETPHIDQIAKNGMVFTNGYANCQVCSPSRASIMTGKFPARIGITDWIGAPTGESWRKMNRHSKLLPPSYLHNLPQEYITLPEALKKAGYKTFFAGKWHLGGTGSLPEDHGFDINIGGWEAGSPSGGYFSPYGNPYLVDGPTGENLSIRLAKETVRFLEQNNRQPVFAFLSFYAVHGPIQASKEKWEKYREKAEKNGIAPYGYKMEHFLPVRQVQDNPIYGGLVETMDDAVGIVLSALKRLGMADNTIVIFTSDNGGVSSGDSFSTSNLPLRGGKGYQFEGGIKEPFFIEVPWLKEGNAVCDIPVTGADFYPTILELAGEKLLPEEHSDGLSLLPLLKGESIPERPLIWHYPHYGNQGGDPSSVIRMGDWKLIHYYEDNHEELYDLENDIGEINDLSDKYPLKVHELHTTLFDYLNKVNAKYPIKDPKYDEKLEDIYLRSVKINKLPQLERKRLEYLSKDFNSGTNWWGSIPTND